MHFHPVNSELYFIFDIVNTMSNVKMFWWNEQQNFGDALNPIIIDKLFKMPVIWAELKDANLVGAGSCLQWVAKDSLEHPHEIHVWGTGYMFDQEPPVSNPLVVHHAVRGKKSQSYGKLENVALGDPGLLSSLLIDIPNTKSFRVGIVPHLWNIDDPELIKAKLRYPDVKIIDVRLPALEVVEQIASCEFIYSSSLHGLIVADSFGIPNQWVGFKKKLFGGTWKFEDYYSVFNINLPSMADFESQILEHKYVNKLINEFQLRDDIKELQQHLINSFPSDLTSKKF